MTKRISVLLVAAMLISCFCMTCLADDEYGVMPCWTYIYSVDKNIAFSGTSGNYSLSMLCVDEVDEIEATATLYYLNSRENWVQQKEWTYSVTDCELYIDEDFTAVAGRTYKVEFEATVYSGSDSESVSASTTKVCPSN